MSIFEKIFDAQTLYCCRTGVFENKVINNGETLRTSFCKHKDIILQELTPKEVRKYLKKMYGGWPTDLPRYQNYRYDTIRYFRLPKRPKVILPMLNVTTAAEAYDNPSIKCVLAAVELTVADKNVKDFLTLAEIEEEELKIFHQDKEKENTPEPPKSKSGDDFEATDMSNKLDKLFEK